MTHNNDARNSCAAHWTFHVMFWDAAATLHPMLEHHCSNVTKCEASEDDFCRADQYLWVQDAPGLQGIPPLSCRANVHLEALLLKLLPARDSMSHPSQVRIRLGANCGPCKTATEQSLWKCRQLWCTQHCSTSAKQIYL